MEHVKSAFQGIGRAISRAFDWLLQRMRGTPAPPGTGAPPAGVPVSTWVLTAVAAGGAVWLLLRMLRDKRPPAQVEAVPVVTARLDDADLSADKLPEEKWLELAEQCLREQNFRFAMRALYLANLAWMGRRELVTLHAAKTNREYGAELRKRGRQFPEARGLFDTNVAVFERAWYGTHEVSPGDVDEFRGRAEQMKRLVAA